MGLQINTIGKYFSKIYKEEYEKFSEKLKAKLLSYKFPLEICLSSDYQNGTLLGTLTFEELDINGYPTYTGDVVKSEEGGFSSITYSTRLIFVIEREPRWVFTLTQPKDEEAFITLSASLMASSFSSFIAI